MQIAYNSFSGSQKYNISNRWPYFQRELGYFSKKYLQDYKIWIYVKHLVIWLFLLNLLQGIKPINNLNPINYLSVTSKFLQPNITTSFLTKKCLIKKSENPYLCNSPSLMWNLIVGQLCKFKTFFSYEIHVRYLWALDTTFRTFS